MPRTRWNSVQYRLARKADNKLTYKQAKAAPEMEGSWKPGTKRKNSKKGNPACRMSRSARDASRATRRKK